MEICDAVEQVSAEAAFSRVIGETRDGLSAGARPLFDRTIAEFKAYQLDDMQREYQAYMGASLKDLAGASEAEFVRENFLNLMSSTIKARRLKPTTASAFETANTQLDRELKRNLRQTIQSWQEDLSDSTFKDHWDEEKSYVKEYEEAARESQIQWIKFRDACAVLATALYDQAGKFDPAVSMKTTLTKNRIAELRSDLFAPQN